MDDQKQRDGHEPEGGHGAGGVEVDHPPVAAVFLLLGVITVVCAAVGVGLWQLFNSMARSETAERDLALPNQELLELRARDRGILGEYAEIDRARGLYRIPIELAMRRLVAEPSLLAPAPEEPGKANAAMADSDAGADVGPAAEGATIDAPGDASPRDGASER